MLTDDNDEGSQYVRKIFRKTNISYPLIRTGTYAYQGKKFYFIGNYYVHTKCMTPDASSN